MSTSEPALVGCMHVGAFRPLKEIHASLANRQLLMNAQRMNGPPYSSHIVVFRTPAVVVAVAGQAVHHSPWPALI